MTRLEDVDGIDGPWERLMDAAMRDDARRLRPAPSVKAGTPGHDDADTGAPDAAPGRPVPSRAGHGR